MYNLQQQSGLPPPFHPLPVDLCNGLRQLAKLPFSLALVAPVARHYHGLTLNELHANVDVCERNESGFFHP